MNDELVEISKSDIFVARDPRVVLAEAKKAAEALMSVVALKKNPVKFNGQQYLEYEDWMTVAKFYGITAKVTRTQFVDYGGVNGFEAWADALRSDGLVISSAEAMCLNDEDNWSTRAKYEWKDKVKTKVGEVRVPLFQLKSMAQTRACAKALRNVLAWVVVLAGFQPTPAEEMTGDEASPFVQKPKPKVQAMDMADFKSMKSKYAGTCKSCEIAIAVGEDILFNSKIKGAVYHPVCLSPKEEAPPAEPLNMRVMIDSLEKCCKVLKTKLIDRIGSDGIQSVAYMTPAYAKNLLEELAQKIDALDKE